ncbi:MAG: glycosyltransferase family 4 protein [Woeseia sp.]
MYNLNNNVMVLNGNRLFPLFRWADILEKHGMLQLFVPGLYYYERYDPLIRILRPFASDKINRGIVKFQQYRTQHIPESKITHAPLSEFFSHIPYVRIFGSKTANLAALDLYRRKAARLARKYRPKVLVIRACYGGLVAEIAKRQGARIITYHSIVHPDDLLEVGEKFRREFGIDDFHRADPYNRQAIFDMTIADAVVTISEYARESLCKHGVPSEKIFVIPEGIDSVTEHVAREEGVCASPGEGPLKPLYAGSIDARKGFIDIVEAMAILDDPTFELVAYGALPSDSPIPDMVRAKNVSIRLLPSLPREKLFREMGQASVFVFPSHAEGGARVVPEAAAMGMAIITTRESASFVEDGVHGIVVKPWDPMALAEAIIRLRDDRTLAARLGRTAREEVFSTYTMANLERRILDMLGKFATELDAGLASAQRLAAS